MSIEQRTYRIEIIEPGDLPVEWFDSAEEAMKAVNRLRALRLGSIKIQDNTNAFLTERELAVIVTKGRRHEAGAIIIV